jgi:hypothetical protein
MTIDPQTNQQTPSLMSRLGTVALGDRGIKLENMDDVFRFAKAVATSQLCPFGFSETDCFVIIQNGLEVGMSPMAALANTYVVNNRATIFGDMPLALVRQSGLLESYSQKYEGKPYEEDYRCIVTTKRKGEVEPIVTEYAVADAIIAELWGKIVSKNGKEHKTPWVTAPKRMLLFRARGFNLRDNFPDVLKGCSIAELNDDYGNEPGFSNAKPAEGKVVEPNFDQSTPAPAATAPAALGDTPGINLTPATDRRVQEEMEPPKRPRGRPPGSTTRKAEAPQTPVEASAPPAAMPTPESPQNPAESPATSAAIPAAEGVDVGSQRIDYAGAKAPATTPATAPKQSSLLQEPKTAAPKPGPFWEVHKRLADQGISHERFLLAMHSFGMVDCDPADISAGHFPLSKVDEKYLRTALHDWQGVLDNLPAV